MPRRQYSSLSRLFEGGQLWRALQVFPLFPFAVTPPYLEGEIFDIRLHNLLIRNLEDTRLCINVHLLLTVAPADKQAFDRKDGGLSRPAIDWKIDFWNQLAICAAARHWEKDCVLCTWERPCPIFCPRRCFTLSFS